ncbi:NADH-dependent [FeFe] hydrogenase, group A6 [Pseudoflavonifractor phocaeensis]|uniref:NADH-dependent [FeFe] hydrogenase, group A6 n=1 Tax=Pseudoflavonifractor phocaeensis TaxID=1870988 RepID=UPI00195D41E0|nr:NADH-dependent [FeFe] hydrogenase, group A6 [Pseudoflavonifractor phocaeensis]MBM6926577.1 iron hydrogenase small subunit [Pseudoflavonifractor phocaeensis]
MLNLTINGKPCQAQEGSTILEAARQNGIHIPSLCYLKDVHQYGTCRICVVEVEGMRNLQASCMVKAKEGMVIHTNSPKVRAKRKVLYELLISNHPKDCLSCARNQSCELQALGEELGVTEARISGEMGPAHVDVSPSITRDTSKCILCRRCVTVCNQIQEVGAINAQHRGFDTVISPAMGLPLNSTACAMCGQCVSVCPTGALTETDAIKPVWKALEDENKVTVIQVAPAVRAALGEEFGMPTGTRCTGKIAAALHALGFDHVFDTDFAADLTILEEGTELLHRLKAALTGGQAVLPMLTSCSPGWIKHIEHAFPTELDHLSTCKAPHTMMGALVKSFYAEKEGIDPAKMYMISVMPCTAKKYEVQRPEMEVHGRRDVDAVLTTRELARMIKAAGIDFANLPDEKFDDPLGLCSGAADIFGVTGGVMEAALRTVYELTTGRELPFEGLHVTPIVGLELVKEAAITFENVLPEYSFLEGVTARVAVTSSLKGADILMRDVAAGTSPYHFIEVMGCPGGCINGGGQPRNREEGYREKRMQALYNEDEAKTLRKSHENPDLLDLYKNYLGEPCGHKSHELLHTTYTARGLYNELLDK